VFSKTNSATRRRARRTRRARAPPSSASAPKAAPPKAASCPRTCSFPMRRALRPGNPPGSAHAMDRTVPDDARRGPPVRRQHVAVRAPFEAAGLRRHLRRHGCVTRSLTCKTRALLSPSPTAIAPSPRHSRCRCRAAPLPASHSQASAHIPSIDPLEPSCAICSGRARVVAGAAPPWPPLSAPVVRPRRRDLRPNTGHPRALGVPTDVPRRFPGRERGRLAGIWPAPPPPMAKGRITSPHLVLWCFP
jgi:hypothetical protein